MGMVYWEQSQFDKN